MFQPKAECYYMGCSTGTQCCPRDGTFEERGKRLPILHQGKHDMERLRPRYGGRCLYHGRETQSFSDLPVLLVWYFQAKHNQKSRPFSIQQHKPALQRPKKEDVSQSLLKP